MLVVCFAGAPVSSASMITYTSRATWTANSSGVSNIDFEGIAASGTAFSTPAGITLSSVNFEGYNYGTQSLVSYLYVVDALYHPNPLPFPLYPYDRGTGASLQGPNGDETYGGTPGDGLLISLPGGGSTAVGADFWAFFFEKTLVPTATFEITFLNGSTNLGVYDFDTLSAPGVQFFGVTSSTPVTRLFIQSKGGGPYIPSGGSASVIAPSTWVEADNFSFGNEAVSSSASPEPSSVILLSGALVALWIRRRSRSVRDPGAK